MSRDYFLYFQNVTFVSVNKWIIVNQKNTSLKTKTNNFLKQKIKTKIIYQKVIALNDFFKFHSKIWIDKVQNIKKQMEKENINEKKMKNR